MIGPKIKDLITAGWLAPFTIFAPERQVDLKRLRTIAGDYALGPLAERMSTDVVLADAIAEYTKHLDGQSALAFCATVKHSQATARPSAPPWHSFCAPRWRHPSCGTPSDHRAARIRAHRGVQLRQSSQKG